MMDDESGKINDSAPEHGDYPFGLNTPCPLAGFPKGRARIRQRPGELVRVWVRTGAGIRQFVAKWHYDAASGRFFWVPGVETARNDTGRAG